LNAADLLPPPRPEERPAPWRALLVFFLPAASLAAGVALQRLIEGPAPSGDFLVRWIEWSCGAGTLLGAAAGLLRRTPYRWAAYGAVGPWLAVALVELSVLGARPVRAWAADRREAACRETAGAVCTIAEFRTSCERGDALALGTPLTRTCAGRTCTSRWRYDGPSRPEAWAPKGSILCSMVVGDDGRLARAALLAGTSRD
jgi:hypothetical protein